jgi:hypothetical protein
MSENILVGKTVIGLRLAIDREALLFQTTDGDVLVRVDADCCSYTWIETVELPALGFPATVATVEDLNLPDDLALTSQFHKDPDVLAFYGCKITTDRGEIIIDYRNDSNGYYGGSLSWPGEYFYGGVNGQNISKLEWQDVF